MPLWRIFSHPQTFSLSQRAALAQAITSIYVDHVGLPAFYVNVLFIDLDTEHVYVGGQPTSNFVRVVVEQIARVMPDPATTEGAAYRRAWMDKLTDEVLRPHVLDRGVDGGDGDGSGKKLHLEMHIAETPRDLWRIQGLDPPPARSEQEKVWKDTGVPMPWE